MLLQAAKRNIENVYDFIHVQNFLTVATTRGPSLLLEFLPMRRV
jgi:hypothetical protein